MRYLYYLYIKNSSKCQVLVFITIVTKEDNAMLHAWKHILCKLYNKLSYNPSIAICWKGCDYAVGRVNDPKGRD